MIISSTEMANTTRQSLCVRLYVSPLFGTWLCQPFRFVNYVEDKDIKIKTNIYAIHFSDDQRRTIVKKVRAKQQKLEPPTNRHGTSLPSWPSAKLSRKPQRTRVPRGLRERRQSFLACHVHLFVCPLREAHPDDHLTLETIHASIPRSGVWPQLPFSTTHIARNEYGDGEWRKKSRQECTTPFRSTWRSQ